MNRKNKQDRFYIDVGDAMFMNNTRSFINLETLEVNVHVEEDYFSFEDKKDTAEEAINNPDKFLAIPQQHSSEAFDVMEAFIETVNDYRLKIRLINALNNKRPFANFKNIIDNSLFREKWFAYEDAAYAQIAKDWIMENAGNLLKEKIQLLAE